MNPTYDVVIVNYNGKDIITDCLQALAASTVKPSKVIICDNGSHDTSVEIIRNNFPDVHLIEEKNIGFGPGNNRGTAEATAEYILYVNNDLFVEPDCVAHLIAALERQSKVAIVSPLIMRGRDKQTAKEVYAYGSIINTAGFTYNVETLPEHAEAAVCFSGACFLARREVMQRHPFEPSYFLYYEEPELAIRLFKEGWELSREPKALCYHLESYSSPETHAAGLAFRQFYGIQNRWFALGKHWPLRLLPLALFFNILHLGVFLLYFLRHKKFGYLTLIFKAPASFLQGVLQSSSSNMTNPQWWHVLHPSSLGTMLGMRKRVMDEPPQ